MGEMEDKLNAILGNQAAMGQIMALAQSLSGKGGAAPSQQETPPPQDEPLPPGETPEQAYAPPAPESSPPAALSGNNPLSMLGDLDPRMIQMGMRLIQEYQGQDDRTLALLNALRPFVKEERFAKLDRAMQVSRLSRVIRVLFESMGKGGEGHV